MSRIVLRSVTDITTLIVLPNKSVSEKSRAPTIPPWLSFPRLTLGNCLPAKRLERRRKNNITIGEDANFETWRAILKRFFFGLKACQNWNVLAQFWKKLYHIKTLKTVKLGKNFTEFRRSKLKTGLARYFFVSLAGRVSGLKIFALDFLNSPSKNSKSSKHAGKSNFGNFWCKMVKTLEQKKISKITDEVSEKRQLRGSVPNFKALTSAIQKLKGKENCENEHVETANFINNFEQKCKATQQLRRHFIPTSNSRLNFFQTDFTWRSVCDWTSRREQDAMFVKSPISRPIVMPPASL